MQARGRSSQRGSGTPITAASSTSGWPISVFSRSTEETHSPPDLITSLDRSLISTKPFDVTAATSPVRSHPSWKRSAASVR
jgi:hypothetical protein